jgi:hypothetical protein
MSAKWFSHASYISDDREIFFLNIYEFWFFFFSNLFALIVSPIHSPIKSKKENFYSYQFWAEIAH